MGKHLRNLYCYLYATLWILFFLPSSALAASNSTNPIRVSAVVPSDLLLEMSIIDQQTGLEVPQMDFGELVRTGNEFQASRFFKVLLEINSAGNPFQLTSSATSLTREGGVEALPSGAYMCKPEYLVSDNAGRPLPVGSQVGALRVTEGIQTLFNDPTGSNCTLTVSYTLSGAPETGAQSNIPLSQKSGNYSGTIQYTLTTT